MWQQGGILKTDEGASESQNCKKGTAIYSIVVSRWYSKVKTLFNKPLAVKILNQNLSETASFLYLGRKSAIYCLLICNLWQLSSGTEIVINKNWIFFTCKSIFFPQTFAPVNYLYQPNNNVYSSARPSLSAFFSIPQFIG